MTLTSLLLLAADGPEPITLADAKLHLRVFDTSEDALIEAYIRAAREWVENYTGHILVQREVTDHFECFRGHMELSKRPVISVDEVAYTDADGAPGTYADPVVTLGRYPVRVYPALNGWFPRAGREGVTITYTAGYAAGEEPQALLQAMFVLIAHFWANRSTAGAIPQTVLDLCDQKRGIYL